MKQIKAFVTRDDLVSPSNRIVTPIYELSERSRTYSDQLKTIYPTDWNIHTLYLFGITDGEVLTQPEANLTIKVLNAFEVFLDETSLINKTEIIATFVNRFNVNNPATPLSSFYYTNIIVYDGNKYPGSVSFTIDQFTANVWLSDEEFSVFYPDYSVKFVTPFLDFQSKIHSVTEMLEALNRFDMTEFNDRIEDEKEDIPSTIVKVINIPYVLPVTGEEIRCYFGFIIYGEKGNYEHILRIELQEYLKNELGISEQTLEQLFPSLLNINEFFMLPRWRDLAISSRVGERGISSQVFKTYSEAYVMARLIPIYEDDVFIKENTYSLPVPFNNLMIMVTNGFYSSPDKQDFKEHYPDIISASSTSVDFSRMRTETQRFLILLETLLNIADSETEVEMFNKLITTTSYRIDLVTRAGVQYLSTRYEDHQYYILPKYEYDRVI